MGLGEVLQFLQGYPARKWWSYWKRSPRFLVPEMVLQPVSPFLGLTREDEEDAGNKGQNGPLRADVANVADDEGGEHKEEADHREGGGCAHCLWGRGRKKDRSEEGLCGLPLNPPHLCTPTPFSETSTAGPAPSPRPHLLGLTPTP